MFLLVITCIGYATGATSGQPFAFCHGTEIGTFTKIAVYETLDQCKTAKDQLLEATFLLKGKKWHRATCVPVPSRECGCRLVFSV